MLFIKYAPMIDDW